MTSLQQKVALQTRVQNLFAHLTKLHEEITSRGVSNTRIQVINSQIPRISDKLDNVEIEVASVNSLFTEEKEKIKVDLERFQDLIDAISAEVIRKSSTKNDSVDKSALPKIKLPIFSGNIAEWVEFKGLFQSLIDENKNLTSLEKFQYLKTTLRGEALSLISHYELDGRNYANAYQDLVDRYSNTRRVAAFYVHELTNYKQSNSRKYSHFLELIRSSTNALKNLGINDLGDYLMFQLAYDKLDSATQKEFDLSINSTLPTLSSLIEFIQIRARSEELITDHKSASTVNVKPVERRAISSAYQRPKVFVALSPDKMICSYCNESHQIYACMKFKSLAPAERADFVRKKKLCFSCLSSKHFVQLCRSQAVCRFCQSKRHHSLCHIDQPPLQPTEEVNKSLVANVTHFTSPKNESSSLLGTIVCEMKDTYGHSFKVRAILDCGSQINAISARLVNKLGLTYQKDNKSKGVSGVGQSAVPSIGTSLITLRSLYDTTVSYSGSAFVLKKICNDLPAQELPASLAFKFEKEGFNLADPLFYKKGPIDLLFGVQAYADIISNETHTFGPGLPTLVKSKFGWIALGTVATDPIGNPAVLTLHNDSSFDISRFWELEEVPDIPTSTKEDLYCEEHFVASHKRDDTGRYSVSLPFKPLSPPISSNLEVSMKCFASLERRFERNSELASAYKKIIKEYLDLGHLAPAKEDVSYLLPHHCVVKADSSSSAYRVVFNASSIDDVGLSLNDRIFAGPRLQNDLTHILLRFRYHPVVFTCDARSMFRQILLNEDSRKFHQILWRFSPEEPIKQYQLQRLTFGVTSSPFLAQRVMQQLSTDEGKSYPLGAKALEDCYVDNVVSGGSSIQEVQETISQLLLLCNKGGFSLHKWSSSHIETLRHVDYDSLEKPLIFSNENPTIKILGLFWEPSTDSFRYRTKPFSGPLTKRNILRFVASTFDPMSWVGPVVTFMKCFIQTLWAEKLDWDDTLSPTLAEEWLAFTSRMSVLSDLRIKRHIVTCERDILYGFCDASTKAYGAVLYNHCPAAKVTRLMISKSKVAPLKTQSIPRLELCAAHLLSRLANSILRVVPDRYQKVYLYSDSATVLKWLKKSPHTLKTFEANRVAKIQELNVGHWGHVRSENNPADCLSRGLMPEEILNHSLWWEMPSHLLPPEPDGQSELFVKPSTILIAQNIDKVEVKRTDTFLKRFSSLDRLVRVLAYVRRFYNNASKKHRISETSLTVIELRNSLITAVKMSQQEDFAEDINRLKNNREVSQSLRSLSPLLDQNGCLTVGGRLQNSMLPASAKHPWILSKSSHLSRLICDDMHLKLLHAGPMTTMSMIRRTYWILSLRCLVRSRIRQCQRCYRLAGNSTFTPRMANLPTCRVTPSRPFSVTVLDFAGPISTKESNRRSRCVLKSYICIFVCTSTRAIHLEYVSSLTTDAFMACLHRFVSRRGIPQKLISDCGRNFIGAARQLKECITFLKDQKETLITSIASLSIEWCFNPPYTPHFTGLAEAGVRSVKKLLIRQIGNTVLTLEEFSVYLHRIEASLNCRPLIPLSSSALDGVDYLTPSHFLIGGPLLSLPEIPIDSTMTPRNRWQLIQQMNQSFWKKWSVDYLNTLIQRNKWNRQPLKSPTVGQLVYVRDLQTSPLIWPIAIIEALHPSADGISRVATLRIGQKTFTRAVANLLPLPMEE